MKQYETKKQSMYKTPGDNEVNHYRYIYASQPKTWRCDILGFSPVKIS